MLAPRDHLPVVLVALLLVLAGCGAGYQGGPAADDTPTGTATDAPSGVGTVTPAGTPTATGASAGTPADDGGERVRTPGFDPPYDPAVELRRTERLRGLNATEPVVIVQLWSGQGRVGDQPDRFAYIGPAGARTLLLQSNATGDPGALLGYADEARDGTTRAHVLAEPRLESHGVAQRSVLVHELVHVLQFQRGLVDPNRGLGRRRSTDALLVERALVEGDATVTQLRYQRRYDVRGFRIDSYRTAGNRSDWANSLGRTVYYYGTQYYRATDPAPAARNRVLRGDGAPRTTRQLLHPGAPPSERSLDPLPAIVGGFATVETDTVGELTVRHALRIHGLSFDRAAGAASGWRDDRMTYYSTGTATVVVWRTAWANASEAREFERAWRDVLAERGATRDGRLRDGSAVLVEVPATDTTPRTAYVLTRAGDTVTVVAGPDAATTGRLAGEVLSANATTAASAPAARRPGS